MPLPRIDPIAPIPAKSNCNSQCLLGPMAMPEAKMIARWMKCSVVRLELLKGTWKYDEWSKKISSQHIKFRTLTHICTNNLHIYIIFLEIWIFVFLIKAAMYLTTSQFTLKCLYSNTYFIHHKVSFSLDTDREKIRNSKIIDKVNKTKIWETSIYIINSFGKLLLSKFISDYGVPWNNNCIKI